MTCRLNISNFARLLNINVSKFSVHNILSVFIDYIAYFRITTTNLLYTYIYTSTHKIDYLRFKIDYCLFRVNTGGKMTDTIAVDTHTVRIFNLLMKSYIRLNIIIIIINTLHAITEIGRVDKYIILRINSLRYEY